jgi:hypothetical protein
MDGSQASEAAEICDVQRKYVVHVMHIHGRRQPRVVHLNSRNAGLHDNSTPLSVDRIVVRQETHTDLYPSHYEVGICGGQTQAIPSCGTCHRVPQLRDILMRVEKSRTLPGKTGKRSVHEFVLGIGASGDS